MPSFNCDGCGDVIKKPKLDSHSSRCRASMTCLDCSTTFPNPASWKGHTSCITEAEKFEKSVYKPPKDKQKKASNVSLVTKAPQSSLSSTTPVPGSSVSVFTKVVESQPQLPVQSSEKSTKKSKKSEGETRSSAYFKDTLSFTNYKDQSD
ncbi:hypothetical protein CROQUDRAFT_498382 [Cronartium quercuum f. sp. fusiforme G11]|uniref:Zinc finger C2H2 LYAR-type domain-containing protein n=1 Tax=Cronartium quercuum f. sp. fusiforme G11 TaxID=708437 RepID=A0A9P6NH41_9BASI|nr:hypothetical protein CROQUDRAFT_498382 [Cronartium quercuum f. sp. fusiforme G11]